MKEYHKINSIYKRDEKTKQFTSEFACQEFEYLQDNLLATVLRKNESINQAQISSLPVQVFDKTSKGAQDFAMLVEEIQCYV